jgi:hypothetical protein
MAMPKGLNPTNNPAFSPISAAVIQKISIPSAAAYSPFTCPRYPNTEEKCVGC